MYNNIVQGGTHLHCRLVSSVSGGGAMQVSFILLLILHLGVVSSTGTPHAFVHPLNPRKEPSDRRVLNNRRSTSQLPLSVIADVGLTLEELVGATKDIAHLEAGHALTTLQQVRVRRNAPPPSGACAFTVCGRSYTPHDTRAELSLSLSLSETQVRARAIAVCTRI